MNSESFHFCLSLRGAIHNRDFGGFKNKNGKKASDCEVLDFLLDELISGKEVIPMGDCDNFCFKTGCKGHPDDREGR